jgi:uncharacterized protein
MATKGYIDADGHIFDRDPDYRRYLEEPYAKRGTLTGGSDGFDRALFGRLQPNTVTPQMWLDMLDRGDCETTVLYTTVGLGVGFIKEVDFAGAFCRAYNNFLSEEWLKVSPRFQGVCLLPFQDVDEAVKELRRAVTELGMVGAMLPADGPFLLGRKEWDPIYAEAERLDVMVAVHAGGSLRGRGLDEYLFDRLLHAHTLSHVGAQMRQMTSIIYDGLPDRFPNLRIAFLEAGCTWVPYMMDRMDEEYEFRGEWDAPHLTKKPSEYITSKNIFVACEPEERLLPETARIIGSDCIVFASDYPHWDGSFPESLHELEGREDLTDEEKHQILVDNPRRLYRLK